MKRGARVHFSFRSPFSWMGIGRLLERVPDAHDRVEFIPYWDPDAQTSSALEARGAEFHYTQMSKAKHLYILHDTKRQAARLGLSMVWPIDDDPWWEVPHLAWLCAHGQGLGPQFYAAVTAARWERGENICDEEVIARIAAAVGLDERLIVAAPHSAELRGAGVDCLVAAYEDDIFGIPLFRVGRHRFWGLDRVDDFIRELLPDADIPAVKIGAYDTDTAGGCG